jgi:hypothetical protein
MDLSSQVAHDETIDRLLRAIVRYVTAHPNASDTVEGVARWWVAADAEQVPLDVLRHALDLLTDRQVLTRRELRDGRHVYAVSTGRAEHETAQERED